MTKQRLSASVDADVYAAAEEAVAAGLAENLSAWVNDAMRRKLEHDRRMLALGELIAEHEAKHGVITERQMEEAERWARENAIVVRPKRRATRASSRR